MYIEEKRIVGCLSIMLLLPLFWWVSLCPSAYTGLEPPQSSGRVEKVRIAHLPCHALPLPSAVHHTQHLMACFCIPSCSGFSTCRGELSQRAAAWLLNWMVWIPPSAATLSPACLMHGVSAGSHPVVRAQLPLLGMCSMPHPCPWEQHSPSSALAWHSIPPMTAVPRWSLLLQLLSTGSRSGGQHPTC